MILLLRPSLHPLRLLLRVLLLLLLLLPLRGHRKTGACVLVSVVYRAVSDGTTSVHKYEHGMIVVMLGTTCDLMRTREMHVVGAVYPYGSMCVRTD